MTFFVWDFQTSFDVPRVSKCQGLDFLHTFPAFSILRPSNQTEHKDGSCRWCRIHQIRSGRLGRLGRLDNPYIHVAWYLCISELARCRCFRLFSLPTVEKYMLIFTILYYFLQKLFCLMPLKKNIDISRGLTGFEAWSVNWTYHDDENLTHIHSQVLTVIWILIHFRAPWVWAHAASISFTVGMFKS